MKNLSAFQHDQSPEKGPQIVFFTGGTALRALSRELVKHTHNSVHIITPFDSGGSSAVLRQAFDMPAVGDIRNRLLALADPHGIPAEAIELCNMRLDPELSGPKALAILLALADGTHPCLLRLPATITQFLREHLSYFIAHMPPNFDLRGASIGNLLLAGGYLHHHKALSPTLELLSKIMLVKGTVVPVVTDNLHLAARLKNGSVVVGQHRITGNSAAELPCPICDIFLTATCPDNAHAELTPVLPEFNPSAANLLRSADLICYPMGSFHTSIMANILPRGVGQAVAETTCPKIYIPNTGNDPEQRDLSVAAQVKRLVEALGRDCCNSAKPRDFLQTVFIDKQNGVYPNGIGEDDITAMGIEICHYPIVDPASPQTHLPRATVDALLARSCYK